MCEGTLAVASTLKARRLEAIDASRCIPILGYAVILVVIFTCFSAALDPCYSEHRTVVIFTSAIWLDSVLSSGMKFLKADAAVHPSGMYVQIIVAALAGTIMSKSENEGRTMCTDALNHTPEASMNRKRYLESSESIWLLSSAACLLFTLTLHPILKNRIDQIGHQVTSVLVLVIWAACAASMSGSSGFFFACNSLSFIAPVLAECLSPVDVDLLQIFTQPSTQSFAITFTHLAINSVDRIYSSVSSKPMDEDRVHALLQMTGTKAAMLFITAAYFRWALARGLEVPFLSANAKLLAKQRGSAQLSLEQNPEYSAELGFVPAARQPGPPRLSDVEAGRGSAELVFADRAG